MLGLKVQDNADFGAEIIRKVREHGSLSRVELARVLGVAASTIGRHVDALVGAGYFTETLEPTREAGRPPTRLRPTPAYGCFVGVDFNAEELFATAVDFAQATIVQHHQPLQSGMDTNQVMNEVIKALEAMAKKASLPLLAVGIAAPGQLDTLRGVGLKYTRIPGWNNVPITNLTREQLKAPVFVENNIRAMALAERWFGEGRGCNDLICFGVRLGVNAGVIRGGQLATGHRDLGGEIRGWNCPIFNGKTEKWEWLPSATIEKHASVPAAVARFEELRGKPADLKQLLEAAHARDQHALLAIREAAAIHGWTISQMVQLIDPEVVVLAGPFTALGDIYLEPVRNFALQFESDFHPSVPIQISVLGDYAGATGAAALALERWRPADLG
jgi:predicted NBD/HSP70 family sugar kinase